MTPDERRSLAEQITTNPLFVAVMDDMEKRAIERLIHEKEDIATAQLRVQAIRAFRADLGRELQDTQPRRGAPA